MFKKTSLFPRDGFPYLGNNPRIKIKKQFFTASLIQPTRSAQGLLTTDRVLLQRKKIGLPRSNGSYSETYLIFVIFFTRANFLENKIYTEIYSVNCQFTQKIANFLRYICKNLHRPKKFTRTPSVATVTNMRYGQMVDLSTG